MAEETSIPEITDDDIRRIWLHTPDEGMKQAEMFGSEELLTELKACTTDRQFWQRIRAASFNLTDISAVTGMPKTTISAAIAGRVQGGTTESRKRALMKFLREQATLANALADELFVQL